jgi:hypothetical protein
VEEEGRPKVEFFRPHDQRLAQLATGVLVQRPGDMVWIDFVQVIPDEPVTEATVFARIVLHPSLLDPLIEHLTAVRDAGPGDMAGTDLSGD